MAIKILTDSASDISEKEAKELGIIMLPMEITFGDEEYLDGVNLLPNQFYEKLIESTTLPKTSQINSFRFNEAFEEHAKNGDEIIAIILSSKLSGTYNSAVKAAQNFNNQVFVIDSLSAALGERLLIEYALKLIKEGKSAQEIVDLIEENKSKVCILAKIDTLEFLKKGGRISSAVAFAGKLLSIKPVVGLVKGEVKMLGKAMGSKNSQNLLNKIIEEKGGIDFSMPYATLWSGLDNTALKKYIKDSSHLWVNDTDNIPMYILGATIGTHIGPGAVGFAFFQK